MNVMSLCRDFAVGESKLGSSVRHILTCLVPTLEILLALLILVKIIKCCRRAWLLILQSKIADVAI